MKFTAHDWQRLRDLRDRFLTDASAEYWTPRDLELYDATFAQRIGWKWDAVLGNLGRLNWRPRAVRLLDWGCGTGIASRTVAAWSGIRSVEVCDQSRAAAQFAAAALRGSGIDARAVPVPWDRLPENTLLLISHVAGELDAGEMDRLAKLAAQAEEVLWIEPGAKDISRRLIAPHEALRFAGRHLFAPCTHRMSCPMATHENDWCHFFASPPPGIFQSPFWREFSTRLEIDLRSLPYSFLAAASADPPALPPNAERLIGRPRERKAHLELLCCGASGLHERVMQKRDVPDIYRKLTKKCGAGAFAWKLGEKGRITGAVELD